MHLRPYLSLLWQGTYYHYLRLPSGYAQAPLLFTKLLWLPFGSLRSQGHLSVVYMDDSYLQGDSVSSCRRNVSATATDFETLMTLSPEAGREVRWWITYIYHCRKFLHAPPITIVIHSDASLAGWGLRIQFPPLVPPPPLEGHG